VSKTTSMSVRFTMAEKEILNSAANKLGWTMTTLMKRAMILIATQINAAPTESLGEIMTPLILTEIRDSEK
jgi:hypothetical protein